MDSLPEAKSLEYSDVSENVSVNDETIAEETIADEINDDTDSEESINAAEIMSIMEQPLLETEAPKVPGETTLSEVVPLPLTIDKLPDEVKLYPAGILFRKVENSYIIKAHKDTPLLDLDTNLFLEDRKILGPIFDVYGSVSCPSYVIIYSENMGKLELNEGMPLFYTDYYAGNTNLIKSSQLITQRGSDASWKNDVEPPVQLLDFSDDEMERNSRKKRKNAPSPSLTQNPRPSYANSTNKYSHSGTTTHDSYYHSNMPHEQPLRPRMYNPMFPFRNESNNYGQNYSPYNSNMYHDPNVRYPYCFPSGAPPPMYPYPDYYENMNRRRY